MLEGLMTQQTISSYTRHAYFTTQLQGASLKTTPLFTSVFPMKMIKFAQKISVSVV